MSSPIKLWIVSFAFAPRWAGPVERFVRYCPALESKDIEVTFITPYQNESSREEDFGSHSVVRIGSPEDSKRSECFFRAAYRFILFHPGRPHVILNLAFDLSQLVMLPLLRWRGVESIFVSTMAVSQRDDCGMRRSKLKDTAIRFLIRLMLNRHSAIVTSTTALRQGLEALGADKAKLQVITNGVNLDRFAKCTEEERRELRKKFQLPQDEFIALFVGLIVQRKGILRLLNAWKAYKQTQGPGRLLLVGDEHRHVPEYASFYAELDELKNTLTAKDGVSFRPATKAIDEWFKVADLFIFMSELEGMPNVLCEAMAARLPVLCNPFEGFSEDFGHDGKELVIAKREIPDIASQLLDLQRNLSIRQDLGNAARAHMTEHNNVSRSVERYVDLIRSLSKSKRKTEGSHRRPDDHQNQPTQKERSQASR